MSAIDRSCPGCGSPARVPLSTKRGHALVRCSACGTVFAGELLRGDQAQDYDAYYHEANLTVPWFEA